MGNPFSALVRLWKEFRKRRQYAHLIAPASIGRMAEELVHLAELAECNSHLSSAELQHLLQLRGEMKHLITITEKAEFLRLSAERRLALYDSLQRSQEKLLTSIQSTQAPTARLQ